MCVQIFVMLFFLTGVFFLQCSEAAIKSIQFAELPINGSKTLQGFDVVLEDTVFFPEGGGQVWIYILD